MTDARTLPPQRTASLLMLTATALAPVAFAVALAFAWSSHGTPRLAQSQPEDASAAARVTDIAIGTEILHGGVKRFGINLSGQTFYESGQMLKNLIFRNPGFEGETWQSILRCKSVTNGSCTDTNGWSAWPAGFLDGARFEILSGSAKGATGTVRTSSAAANGNGVTLSLADPPKGLAADDFVLVRMEKPGDAQAGWWTWTSPGATLSTEFHDLAPGTLGKQALRVDASAPGQMANISSYFDSTEGRSFLQLHGRLSLRFRAKWLSGNSKVGITVARAGGHTFLQKDIPLTPAWQSYAFEFPANEDGSAVGTVGLTFSVQQSSVLLDDVELVPIAGDRTNSTAFRDEVVDTLRELHPGVLRFMDNGTSFGSTLDDLLAPPFARRRGGSLLGSNRSEDVPIGLHESLVLAQAVGAEPWYTLPATLSPEEARNLIEYLAGPASTPYGAKRAALGQTAPWTTVFPTIHLEFGNEMWGTFPGAAIPNPSAYASRAATLFAATRSSQWFHDASFDLIADAQAPNTWWTGEALKTNMQSNSIDFAPYLFGEFNDASSNEAIFGSMFAEPEQLDTTGYMAEQVKLARNAAHPAVPAIYEVNLGTSSSVGKTITQADIDRTVPSVGGAIAVADHMLLMLRELGITTQCLFALPEFANKFSEPGDDKKTTPLWGAVIDMGGPTNLRRPIYLALELMNSAMLPNEFTIHLTGANPTWNQAANRNDGVTAGQPHMLQTFAFGDGARRSLILLNLSRTLSLPVTFSGVNRPANAVTESRLTSANITDNNEHERKVSIAKRELNHFDPASPYRLPPFSMTVLEWQASR
jgi:alpha-L-arabinofuranosidase